MNTNFFSSGSSILSNDALASSWKSVQAKHYSQTFGSTFKTLDDYEIIPDTSLPLEALYWKRKYNELFVRDREVQGGYQELLQEYEDIVARCNDEKSEKNELFVSYTNALEEIERLKKQEQERIKEIERLKEELRRKDEELERTTAELNDTRDKLKKAEAKLNIDSTNSGKPTSQTPYNKNKLIPNTRKKTTRHRGGQPGHKKHGLDAPDESEITDVEVYEDPIEALICGMCGSRNVVQVGFKTVYQEEVVTKVIHKKILIATYMCTDCGNVFDAQVPKFINPNQLTQYGPNVKSLIASLLVYGDVSINRVQALVYGITSEQLHPSQGFICEIVGNMAKELRYQGFDEDLRKYLVYEDETVVHWDDTVVFVQNKRACVRFYGNEGIALYTAHMRKNREGLIEDNVLPQLAYDRVVMHDHITINYNPLFAHYQNAECNIHLHRDLVKGDLEFTNRNWPKRMDHLFDTIAVDRKELEKDGADSFSGEQIQSVLDEYQGILDEAQACHDINVNAGETWDWLSKEQTLINRLAKFEFNYLGWMYDFSIPTNNNLAERSLRLCKTKMKVSGQFFSEATARNFALVLSYTETAKRHGINPYDSLHQISLKHPFTVKHIMSRPVQHSLE